MCGIFGWLGDPNPQLAAELRDRLRLRGPDAEGAFADPVDGVWLGHRRLSIVDLSEAGSQPMASPGGRFVVTYNGEIFNHADIRRELEAHGVRFRGHSDTEVLIAAIELWGVEKAVQKAIGFFAFGVWDRQEKTLQLARDRLGIKPLLYAAAGAHFAFASDLRAFKGIPWLDDRLDPAAVASYFRYLAVSAPETILRGVRKLEPGRILEWRRGAPPTTRSYWSLREVVPAERRRPFQGTFREAADDLERLLSDSIQRRLMGDVPVGAFLSGGVDSSTVVALMQRVSGAPVRTFTIAFEEKSHNEAPYARAVAKHLGTEHHERLFRPQEMYDLAQRTADLHDEPFADVGSLPSYMVSVTARERVTVALSGDGGDELFGGYPRYFWAHRIQRLQRLFGPTSSWVSRGLTSVPRRFWDGPVHRLSRGRFAGAHGLSDRVSRFAGFLATDTRDAYRDMMSAWTRPRELVGDEPPAQGGPHPEWFADLPWAEQMMAVDQCNYMVDDILTKVDRTSMATSLEVRVPLLDHRVVEFSWRLPSAYKLSPHGDRGKLLLREVLYRYVPREMIERPKAGFGVPISAWLRGPLRDWVESTLEPSRVQADGHLNPDAVARAWRDHLDGKDRHHQIWTLLMYFEWRKAWGQVKARKDT